MLVSGSSDGTVKIWRQRHDSWVCLATLDDIIKPSIPEDIGCCKASWGLSDSCFAIPSVGGGIYFF